MKIVKKSDAIHLQKPEGIEVWYYLFPEYEIHINNQDPQTTQAWHYHEKIDETVVVLDGEITIKWKEDGVLHEEALYSGDLVKMERTNHTFENKSDRIARLMCVKQVLSGKDNSLKWTPLSRQLNANS